MPKLVDEGENRIAEIIFGAQAVDANLYLGIYMNSTEPAETEVLADIVEPVGNGYARLPLARGSWTIADDLASYAQQIFEAVGGDWGECNGYFIASSNDGSGKLMFVEQFADAPYNITDGDRIKITPKVTVS